MCMLEYMLRFVDDDISERQDKYGYVVLEKEDEDNIEWVHALGVSVEIELKMDWQVCKNP